ncbi:MAG: hypothetical protein KDE20_26020, partial [Caldilineaceae bacterium]|nr:hypothetical protein [Caldilineaceae bacterium]
AGGTLEPVLRDGTWRILAFPAVMILYNLIMAPWLSSMDERIAEAIRPLSHLSDAAYAALVAKATATGVRGPWLAFGLGILAQIGLYGVPRTRAPLDLYMFVTFMLMYGTMGWLIYRAVVGTHLSRALPRQPLSVNVFDITPFEPIGRQSLLLAMAFVGGATVSLFFILGRDDMLQWPNLVIYATLILITLAVFFSNMWPTHRLLAAHKKRHRAEADATIAQAYGELTALTAEGANTAHVESTISAWAVIDDRLKLTRTWPYNTEMLRTLVITVLTPLAVGISRIIAVIITSGRPQ